MNDSIHNVYIHDSMYNMHKYDNIYNAFIYILHLVVDEHIDN